MFKIMLKVTWRVGAEPGKNPALGFFFFLYRKPPICSSWQFWGPSLARKRAFWSRADRTQDVPSSSDYLLKTGCPGRSPTSPWPPSLACKHLTMVSSPAGRQEGGKEGCIGQGNHSGSVVLGSFLLVGLEFCICNIKKWH